MRQMMVHFAGEGAGVAELSWGQQELLGAMQRQQTWMPLPHREPLPPGTTLADVADWLRYIVSRHQVLRTRLRFPADGPPRQVVHGSGHMPVDLVEAGREDPAVVAQRMADHYDNLDYDFERDWPIFVAVILRDGVPAWRVVLVCHIVWDAFGALALLADVSARAAADGAPPPPVTALQPLDQVRWQRSPAGQRHNEATLRHWARLLREMPAQRFPPAVDRGEPRYWMVSLTSPATHLAIEVIRHRTRAGSAQVILTAFLMALARVTGINPAVARVAVNNRFRPGLADSVSVIIQYGLCLLDVAGASFDEALDRLGRRIIATFKNAYFAPDQLAELVERIGRERGQELDIHCYYNDRRFSQDAEPGTDPPSVAEVRAALSASALTCEPLTRGSERLFAAIEEAPGSFRMILQSDTRYLSRQALEAFARVMEQIAVAAATRVEPAGADGAPLTGDDALRPVTGRH